ncbi:MAG: reverse transcriptase family protein [Acinetobacter sp.]|nr:reverse transcriptase family protein [Acinetobacter sp.]
MNLLKVISGWWFGQQSKQADQENDNYKIIKIKRKNKKARILYVPNDELKEHLKSLLPDLQEIYKNNVLVECDHAFVQGKNCITHAMQHTKQRFVLKMDIENFFHSIHTSHVAKYIPNIEPYALAFINDKLPQGFPTSPILANIAMIEIDYKIQQALNIDQSKIFYTRYADDLTFSFNDRSKEIYLIAVISDILKQYKLRVNRKKTKLFDKHHGRATITGVGVSLDGIHPTRKIKKKLRAAKHQQNESSVKGLQEWIACKLPKAKE